VKNGADLDARVHTVPEDIDREVARLKLESLGVEIDTLTEAQRKYLHSWEQGT
jgi:adenosylhomocysteinase